MKKLRPHIHDSYSYLISKLYDSEYALIMVSVRTLQSFMSNLQAAVDEKYASSQVPDGLRYSLDEVNYVLRRLTEMEAQGQLRGNDDITIYGDALRHRIEELLEILDEIDADTR